MTDLLLGLRKTSAVATGLCPGGDSGGSAGADVVAAWVQRTGSQAGERAHASVRFAFYGRVSTEDWQDPVTQWRRIEALAAEPGPFIRRVSRTAMTAIALD